MSFFLNFLLLLAVGLLSGGLTATSLWLGQHGKPWWPEAWFGINMVANVVIAALNLVWHQYGWVIAFIIFAIMDGIQWWRWHKKRRKKRPVGALVGEKSRALIAKLVRTQREATTPTN